MIDLLTMLVATAALVYAALVTAWRLRGPGDTAVEHALTVALLVGVGILAVSLLVGLPGLFRPAPLVLASVAVALAARLALGGLGGGRDGVPVRERASSLARSAAREPLAAAAAALAGLALLNRALIALVLPPGGYDSIAYHLVFVGDWVRRGTIGGSDFQQTGCCGWYPVNAEITYAWLAVFPHSDRLVGLAQVGYLGIGALAIVAIARAVGASSRWAVVAGALFAVTPVALGQASLAYSDVALTAAVLVTAAFMLRLLRADAGRNDVLRFALAAGFTLGVKGTAIPYVAAACLVLAVGLAVRSRRPSRTVVARAGALVALVLVLGSGWYVRAWVATGNPLWPYRIEAAGHVVFDGVWSPTGVNPTPEPIASLPAVLHAPRSWLHDLDLEARMSTEQDRPDARLGGLGLTWLLIGLPAVIATFVLTLRRRDLRFAAVAVAVGLPALVAVPDPWWARFTIPLAAVGMVALAWIATRLPRAAARAVVAAALLLAVIGVVTTRPLGPLAELERTAGTPLERPALRPDGLDYAALEEIPDDGRVGVLPGGPLLRYLVLGERFSREVVPLPDHRREPEALTREIEGERLEYVVARVPLPDRILAAAPLVLVAASSGAAVYRAEPSQAAASGTGYGR